ncbi:MAG: 3-hydroxyacyl-ACP dehydratase FabZ [Bacteroidales bacterium]|jgi:3-hydroxyacyl-[acyl-carrier-protein] dehydratase|nr:3-hydroxyacyl-ACP dehydratase FabZ [Bacteroidales bacterium]
MTNIITLNREEIKQYLPHREPMLLVDEMALFEDENGKKIAHGKYHVTGYEHFLEGHFPSHPVVPGVILCEIMGQTSSVLLLDALIGRTPFFTGIDNARFKRPVQPHDTVEVTATLTNKRGLMFFVEASAHVDGELCSSAKLTFALVDNDKL